MHSTLLYPVGSTEACRYAASYLSNHSISVSNSPSDKVTHLLLDVPSFRDDSRLRNGDEMHTLLKVLPKDITIIGGNLNHPDLAQYDTVDLLTQEDYLCKNAAITAHCALAMALGNLKCALPEASVWIIGWGRIGKCLASFLKQNGCDIWLTIRNPKDSAMARALGYHVISPSQVPPAPKIIFNTVPTVLYREDSMTGFHHCIKMDLASAPGLEGDDVIIARGLPGKCAPESSGRLIGQTILDYLKEE